MGKLEHRKSRGEADFERFLPRLSTLLTQTHWHRMGEEVNVALQQVLDLCALDLVAICEVLPHDETAYLRFAVDSGHMRAVPRIFNYGEWFPWTFSKVVLGGELLALERDKLTAAAATDKASMQTLGLCEVLHIPIQIEEKVRFIVIAGCRQVRPLHEERFITRLRAIGEIVVFAIHRAEIADAFMATQHQLRDTLNDLHLGQWEWDIAADRITVSDEAKHVLGTDVSDYAQLIGLVGHTDREKLEQSIACAREEPGARVTARYAIYTPAGEQRLIQQWHEAILPGARTERLVATVRDVTTDHSAERELAQLREYRWHSARVTQSTLLVASLAHELCQPLTAILTNAQAGLRFLKNGKADVHELRSLLGDITASNRRANEVLGALRSMLRRQQTTRITFDAADAVRDVLALVRSELMSEQIDVETSLAPQCYVNADKTQIEQVVLNLVMNSIDAMRGERWARCQLGISLSGSEEQVHIAVVDSGRGIPAEKMSSVFEAFWTTKQKGLGMGLQVCRAIVESYGGRIWCESNDLAGVTFHVIVPLAHPTG